MQTFAWLFMSMTALAHGADELPADGVAAPSIDAAASTADPAAEAMAMAVDLVEAGHADSARATLDWVLDQDIDPTLRSEAESLQATLTWRRRDVMPAMRLAAWQTALGAYLMGPHMARISYDPNRTAAPYFIGAAGGAAVGAGSAIWMAAGPGLSQGQANTVIAAQQLGGFNGAVIATLIDADDSVSTSIGLLAGVGVGTAGGYLLTMTHPTPGVALGAHSGAVWGRACGAAGSNSSGRYDEGQLLRSMLIWGDIGTLGGLALAHRLDLSRSQVWAMNLGGVIGGTGTLVTLAMVTIENGAGEQTVIGLGIAGSLIGGGVGLWLSRRTEREQRHAIAAAALISGTDRDVRIGLPLPTPIPSDDGLAYGLPLVAYRF